MTCPLSPALLAKIQRFFPEDSDAAGNHTAFQRIGLGRYIRNFYRQPGPKTPQEQYVDAFPDDATGWEAERPLVPKMLLSTLFPSWPVYTPFEALDAWASTANKLERGAAPRWTWYGPMDPGIVDLIRRGFLQERKPWTT